MKKFLLGLLIIGLIISIFAVIYFSAVTIWSIFLFEPETAQRVYLTLGSGSLALLAIVGLVLLLNMAWLLSQPERSAHVRVLKLIVATARQAYDRAEATYHEIRMSEKALRVKVLDETYNSYDYIESNHHLATFEFPDGLEKEFRINDKYAYDGSLKEGATGTLTYKELENAKDFSRRSFVSFEVDS